jgi:hypothetical protein
MKKLALIFALFGITSSCSLLKGAEFTTEVREAAQKALTEEEKEEQASQKRLAEQKAKIQAEWEEQELMRKQRRASTQLQRASARAKKASEELRMAVSKIGSDKTEQESVEHIQSTASPISEEQLGYLARLPAERSVDLAYHLVDRNRPLESLQEMQSLLEKRPDTAGELNNPQFLDATLTKLFLLNKRGRVIGGGAAQVIAEWKNPTAYRWLADQAKRSGYLRGGIRNTLIGFVEDHGEKAPDSLTDITFLQTMLASRIITPDQITPIVDRSNLEYRYTTAYHFAVTHNDYEVANLLLQYGANPAKETVSAQEFAAIKRAIDD